MASARTSAARYTFTLALAAALMSLAVDSAAQETRAELMAREKAKKAQRLHPYQPSAPEKIVTRLGRGLFEGPTGIYPVVGSIYSGGGLAAGPGVRLSTGGESYIDARAMYSIREYKLLEGGFSAPSVAGGPVSLRLTGGWLDATQIGFYGIGMDTSDASRTNYRMTETYAGAELALRLAGPLRFGGGAAYEAYEIGTGRGSHPSLEDVAFDVPLPGRGADPAYAHLFASAGLDTRPASGYARRGTRLNVDYHTYRDQDSTFSFDRVDAEAVQHVPILRENWVLSLRGRLQSTIGDEDEVPYFMLPALGSGSTLRAYSTGRFRDRHALLLQAEWRWIVNKYGLDMAIFYDAGKVASRRGDLDLQRMKTDVGIGARLHGPRHTFLRLDLARSREGLHLVIATSAPF